MSAALSLLTAELCGDIFCCCLPGWLSWPSLTPCRAFSSAESRECLTFAYRSKGGSVTPKISGLCHFGPLRPNPDPYRVVLKLFQQHSLLAQSFFASSGWIELLHLDVTYGPPWEPQWKRCLTHRCLLSSRSPQLPRSCLESWQGFARRQRRFLASVKQ